jgi:hypothetical protein
VRDLGELATFRRKLAVIIQSLGLPQPALNRTVTADRLPCAVIQNAVATFRPDTTEWKGSELIDGYLACLSAYADVTYVDKRTHEALRQARQSVPALVAIMRRLEKAGDYADIAKHLEQDGGSPSP